MFRVVVLHVPVVSLGMSVGNHADTSSQTFLDEEVHVGVCDKIKFDVSGL